MFEKIIDRNNIEDAIFNASKKKQNRNDVIKVMLDLDNKVTELQRMIKTQKFKTSPYSHRKHIDNSSGKQRDIMRPKFYPDQCVQWAVMQILEPIIMKGHYYHSCGSIPGKGSHFAKKYVERWVRKDFRNTKYVLQIDVTKYYPSICHEKLKLMFRRKIKCYKTLMLVDEIIEGGGQGLPIGNYTSQWFANFYLQSFDQYVKQELKIKYYVRYMDDMVIFGSNKKKLHKIFRVIDKDLNKLKLKVKDNWQVFKFESRPLDFLGYRFYRNKTTLRRRNFLRIVRRMKKISKKEKISFKDACAIISYMGWIKSSDSHYLYEKYIKPYVNISEAKEVIRNESKKRHKAKQI